MAARKSSEILHNTIFCSHLYHYTIFIRYIVCYTLINVISYFIFYTYTYKRHFKIGEIDELFGAPVGHRLKAMDNLVGKQFLKLLHRRVFHIIDPAPLLGFLVFRSLAAVFIEELGQFVAVYPDFVIAFFLGFIKNQFKAPMQMDSLDIIHIFSSAVACMAHISDDISCRNDTAFFQFLIIWEILSQMGIVIIPLTIEAADTDTPAAVLIPAKRFNIAGFYGNDGCTNLYKILLFRNIKNPPNNSIICRYLWIFALVCLHYFSSSGAIFTKSTRLL